MKRHIISELPELSYRRVADFMDGKPSWDLDTGMGDVKEDKDNSFQPPLSVYIGPSRGPAKFRLEVYDANGETLTEYDDYTKTRKTYEYDIDSFDELMRKLDSVKRELQVYGPPGDLVNIDDPAGFLVQASRLR